MGTFAAELGFPLHGGLAHNNCETYPEIKVWLIEYGDSFPYITENALMLRLQAFSSGVNRNKW